MQIHQIVLGFGEFDLDNPRSICNELDKDQIQQLVDAVKEAKWFVCNGCFEAFCIGEQSVKDEKMEILKQLP